MSTVAVGITFAVLMHPSNGPDQHAPSSVVGIDGPSWLTDPDIALLSVALVDVWKGVGIALVIFIAGILSIPEEYTDAVRLEGGAWAKFRHVIVPLSRNATFTVILLSFIGGLRTFDLIWTMTRGGPGFTTDVITSTIYKQYQAGFYGLATAGNVILFIAVTLIVYPMMRFFNRARDRAVRAVRQSAAWWLDVVALVDRGGRLRRPVRVHRADGRQGPGRGVAPRVHLADRVAPAREHRRRCWTPATASWSRRCGTAWS